MYRWPSRNDRKKKEKKKKEETSITKERKRAYIYIYYSIYSHHNSFTMNPLPPPPPLSNSNSKFQIPHLHFPTPHIPTLHTPIPKKLHKNPQIQHQRTKAPRQPTRINGDIAPPLCAAALARDVGEDAQHKCQVAYTRKQEEQ